MQACFWEAFPFLVIMLAWLFVLVVLLVVRTALYLRGEVRLTPHGRAASVQRLPTFNMRCKTAQLCVCFVRAL